MEEYGLSPDELIAKDFRRLQSSRRGYYPYGKRDWIVAVKKVYKRDGNIFAKRLQNKYLHLYTQGTWLFGDWDKALRAAGFDPERMRIRRLWDSEKVVERIHRMRAQNLPLYAAYAMKNQQDLFAGALRRYGSWNNALVAAGVPKKEIPKNLGQNRFVVLRALRGALKMHSRDEISEVLKFRAAHYFGSLRKAVAALKNNPTVSQEWNKEKIITAISRMHRSKRKLNYATGRRDFPALVSAAEAYCGSWGKALYAAGIDPNLYFVHHTWRKSRFETVHT